MIRSIITAFQQRKRQKKELNRFSEALNSSDIIITYQEFKFRKQVNNLITKPIAAAAIKNKTEIK